MNLDKKEIDNFDIYAHEWWNKRGPYKLIHNLTPLRVEYIQNSINVKGLNILDIGCGGGLLAEELTKKGANVTGLDASKKTINIAKQHAKESNLNINYVCSTLESFIEKDKKDNHEIVIRIGPFPNEDDAVHGASYIYATQQIDLTDSIKPYDATIH